MEFPEGRGGPFCEPILEIPEGIGCHRKNPFREGVWIFSGSAQWPIKIMLETVSSHLNARFSSSFSLDRDLAAHKTCHFVFCMVLWVKLKNL